MRLPKQRVVISVLLLGVLKGLCLPPWATSADEPARLEVNQSSPPKEIWSKWYRERNAAEADFLGGWFYLAKQKQESFVEYSRSHFAQNHWAVIEGEITLKQLQRVCELPVDQRSQVQEACRKLSESRRARDHGEYDIAIRNGEAALEILTKLDFGDTPLYYDVLRSVALGHRFNWDDDFASTYFSQYLDGIKKLYGSEHPDVIRATSDLAEASSDFWSSKKSLMDSLQKARDYAERNPNDPARFALLIACNQNLAHFCETLGEDNQARDLYLLCLQYLQEAGKGTSEPALIIRCELARSYRTLGELERAKAEVAAIDRILSELTSENRTKLTAVTLFQADLYAKFGEIDKARSRLEAARAAALDEISEPDSFDSVFRIVEGSIAYAEGNFQQADALCMKELAYQEKKHGKGHPSLRWVLECCVDVKEKLGQDAQAKTLRQRLDDLNQKIAEYKAHGDK